MAGDSTMREDVREVRSNIGSLHEKVDEYARVQTELIHRLDKRVLIVEQRPVLSQPCTAMTQHQKWHDEEQEKSEKLKAKWGDRMWSLFVRYMPTLAAVIAAAFAYKAGNSP